MSSIPRAELERRLARHLMEEVDQLMVTTDVQHQQDLLESRLHHVRRRRPVYVAAMTAAAVAVAVVAALLFATRSTGPGRSVPAAPLLPQPAAAPLTVYESAGNLPGAQERVISFLDTRGLWCTATLNSAVPPSASDYTCRGTRLTRQLHGFGTVYGVGDAPSYDNFRSWFGGVASGDITRVDVVFSDGRVVAAKVLQQGSAHGVVFSLAWPTTTSNPAYYRAYGANGQLVQQVPVKQAVIPK